MTLTLRFCTLTSLFQHLILYNMHIKFNPFVEDSSIWNSNKNDAYTSKSGYSWLLYCTNTVTHFNTSLSWSWIWKLKLPEKLKFLFCLACHNSSPTLLLLNHINIAPSAVCPRCGLEDETFLHCVRDCTFSRAIWHHVGFLDADFFANMEVTVWLKDGSMGSQSFLFASCVWWAWRHRNLMCLNNENWHINRLAYNIHGMVDSFKSCYAPITNVIHNDRFIKWSNGNHIIVLSSMLMHGSCMGTPVRAGFGGVIRNYAGFYLSGFSGYIPDSSDILCVELYAIYQGLILAKSLDITELVCYSNSLLCINLLKGTTMRFEIPCLCGLDSRCEGFD